jgi:hypothetical protein
MLVGQQDKLQVLVGQDKVLVVPAQDKVLEVPARGRPLGSPLPQAGSPMHQAILEGLDFQIQIRHH